MMLNGNNQTVPQVVVEDMDGQDGPEQPAPVQVPEQPAPVQVPEQPAPVQAPEESGAAAESPAVVPAPAAEAEGSASTEKTCTLPDPAQISESHDKIDEVALKASQTSTLDPPAEEISQVKPDPDQLVESQQVKTEPASDLSEQTLAKVKAEPVSDASEQSSEIRRKSISELIQSLEDCSLKGTAPDLISFEAAPKIKTEVVLDVGSVRIKTEPVSDSEETSQASSLVKPELAADVGHHSEPSQLPAKAAIEEQTSEAAIQIKSEPASNLVHTAAEILSGKSTAVSGANQQVTTATKDDSKPSLDSVKLEQESREVKSTSVTTPAEVPLESSEKPSDLKELAKESAVSAQPNNVSS